MQKTTRFLYTFAAAVCALAFLAACSTNSPFVARSEARPGDGKIPVAVTASVNASGSTASNAATDYTGGVAVTFGRNAISGNLVGAPLTSQGVTLDNGCVADAVQCCTELKDSGAEAQIFLAKYTVNGASYGHAMTRFYWPPRFGADGKQRLNAYSVAYVYDRQNASTPLPSGKVDAGNATSIARYMLPGVSWAAWADQTPFQDRQDRQDR